MRVFNEDKAVASLSEIVALECGVHPSVARQIRIAAALHDVGKQKISPAILNKPGKLTEQEFELMKQHTRLGAEMLNAMQGNLGEMSRLIALYHHEFWNGNGYWHKHTDELPLSVAIVSICDVFTALISDGRPYKSAWPPEDALAYIQKQAGTQFSPTLTKVFLPLARDDHRVKAVFEEVAEGCPGETQFRWGEEEYRNE